MKEYKYLILASLISPFLGVFIVTYLYLSISTIIHGARFEAIQFMLSSAATALLGHMISLPAVLLLGVPIYFFLNKSKLSVWWLYCIVGYICGAAIYLIFFYKSEYALEIQINGINMFGFYGLSVSFVFWLISAHLQHRSKIRTNNAFKRDAKNRRAP